MKKYMLFILMSALTVYAHGQVEHNFEKNPENTDCHELPELFKDSTTAIALIRSSTFRFRQTIKISRIRIPRSASYYSCDGQTGFIIAEEDDVRSVVYADVPQEVWQSFMDTSDPISFYQERIKGRYGINP